jgi:hypothetical protein
MANPDGMGGMARSLAFTALLEHDLFAKSQDKDGLCVTRLLEEWDRLGRPDFWEFAKRWAKIRGSLAGWCRKYCSADIPADWDDGRIVRETLNARNGPQAMHMLRLKTVPDPTLFWPGCPAWTA